jgi:hypothetical protein
MSRKRIIDCDNYNGKILICGENTHPQCKRCNSCVHLYGDCENCENRCPACLADCTKCHLNCAIRGANFKVF